MMNHYRYTAVQAHTEPAFPPKASPLHPTLRDDLYSLFKGEDNTPNCAALQLLELYGLKDAVVINTQPLSLRKRPLPGIVSLEVQVTHPIDFSTDWPDAHDLVRELLPEESWAKYSRKPITLNIMIDTENRWILGVWHPDFPELAWDMSLLNLTAEDMVKINTEKTIDNAAVKALKEKQKIVSNYLKLHRAEYHPFLVLGVRKDAGAPFPMASDYFVFTSSLTDLNTHLKRWVMPYTLNYVIVLRHFNSYDPSGYHPNPVLYPAPRQREVPAEAYEDGISTLKSIALAERFQANSTLFDDATGAGTMLFLTLLNSQVPMNSVASDRDPVTLHMVGFNAQVAGWNVRCVSAKEKGTVHPNYFTSNAPSFGGPEDFYPGGPYDSGYVGLVYFLELMKWYESRESPCESVVWNRARPESNFPRQWIPLLHNCMGFSQTPNVPDPGSTIPTAPMAYDITTGLSVDLEQREKKLSKEDIPKLVLPGTDPVVFFSKVFSGEIIIPQELDKILEVALGDFTFFEDLFPALPIIIECIASGKIRIEQHFLQCLEEACFGDPPENKEEYFKKVKYQNVFARLFDIPSLRNKAIMIAKSQFFVGDSITSAMSKHSPFSVFSKPMSVEKFIKCSTNDFSQRAFRGLRKGNLYSFQENEDMIVIVDVEQLREYLDYDCETVYPPIYYFYRDMYNIIKDHTYILFKSPAQGNVQTLEALYPNYIEGDARLENMTEFVDAMFERVHSMKTLDIQ